MDLNNKREISTPLKALSTVPIREQGNGKMAVCCEITAN
jgi:hypothetical protein